MGNNTLVGEIDRIITSRINDIPVAQEVTVTKAYSDGYANVTIKDTNELFIYVKCLGDNTVGTDGILTFLNGDINNPIVITSNTQQNETNTIIALGLGLFTIRNGKLYVELPMGKSNPFRIENGKLIVTLPEGASNNYEIIGRKLIYHRGVE